MAQSIIRVTNLGAQKTGEQLVLGRSYMIKYFGIGSAGHDPVTGLPVVPDQTLVELPSSVFTTPLPIPPGGSYIVGPRVVEYKITLDAGIATGPISSIGLYGEITSVVNPDDSALIGSVFLHSIGNFALSNKATNETKTLTLRLNNV